MTEEHEYNTSTETTETPNEVVNANTEEKAEEQITTNISPTGQRLRAYFDRIERLEEAKKEVAEDMKEVYAEAKGDGFDVKAMRKIAAMRKKDPADLAEENEIIETYLSAMGMKF